MKKLITYLVAFIFSITLFGQTQLNTLLMPDLTTNFPISLPAYSLVYVQSNTTLYTITSYYATTDDVQQAITDGNADAYGGGAGASFWESNAPGFISAIGGVTKIGRAHV